MEDEKLIALLDQKFAESEERMTARIDARFEQVDARFDQVDARFDQVDARFEQVDARFEQVDARFERSDARVGRMETQFDNLRIEVGARLDDMHGDIKKIAESVCLVDEKLEDFRAETKANFKTVHEVIGASNAQLISRIRKLEKKAS